MSVHGYQFQHQDASVSNWYGCTCRSPAAGGDEVESDDDSLMPAVNLSNRLNPNNVHFDRQLAAQYKRMSKHEKEALWAADRARQHQLRELTELSQMAGLNATELSQLTELTQVLAPAFFGSPASCSQMLGCLGPLDVCCLLVLLSHQLNQTNHRAVLLQRARGFSHCYELLRETKVGQGVLASGHMSAPSSGHSPVYVSMNVSCTYVECHICASKSCWR